MIDEHNEQPFPDENNNFGFLPPAYTPEMLHELRAQGKVLVDIFKQIYLKEKSLEEQSLVLLQRGVPGALGQLIDEVIPPLILAITPYTFVELAQKCMLFGYVLNEVVKRSVGEGDNTISAPSPSDLEKLWGDDNDELEEN